MRGAINLPFLDGFYPHADVRLVVRLHVVVHSRVVVADVGLRASLWHCGVLEWRLRVRGVLQLSNITNNVCSYPKKPVANAV